jgi:3-oxoacyl-[acyl-carrier protein] reductase
MLVVITGTSRGIGLQLVKYFSQLNGCLVVAVSRDIKPIQNLAKQQTNSNILPLKANINKPEGIKAIVSTIKKIGIPLDILINNAATFLNKPFEKINLKELQGVYQTNVFAPFILTQQLLPFMGNNKKTKSHIINISSMGGFMGSSKFSGLSAYSTSKMALSGLTECLAEELKEKNIGVNCLALGAVQTEMLNKAFPGYKAPLMASQMAEFIGNFAVTGQNYFNGKVLPVSLSTP